ncbi:MAG: TRAP transporter substrate-binding protein [Desulfobacula sp.]
MKRHLSIVCAFMFVLCVTLLPVQAEEIKLRYSNMYPPPHPFTKMMEEWAKEIDAKTQGRVKITLFSGGTLTPAMQTYDSTVKGVADLGTALLAYSPGRFPLSEVLTLPLGYNSGIQATKAANAYYKKFMPKEFGDVQVMYFHVSPPGFIMTTKVIGSTEELKGLRIRANTEVADIVTALGGSPVTIPIPETYDSVKKGLLDGLLFPVEALKGWKMNEVVGCVLESKATSYGTSLYVVMNKDKWATISKDDQAVITKINEEMIEKQGNAWDAQTKLAKEESIQKGVKFVAISAADDAKNIAKVKPILDKYIADMKTKGLPGDEALKFMQDYLQANP